MTDVAKPIAQQTRAEQTKYLSREFVIGFILQIAVLGGGIAYAYGSLAEKVSQVEPSKVTELQKQVAVLEDNQIDGDRVTRLELKLDNLSDAVTRLQVTLDREAARR